MLEAWFVESDGKLRNQRLETERRKQSEYREQQSLRGKAGAEARWNGSRDGPRHASANGNEMEPLTSDQCHSDSSPSSSPPSVFGFQTSPQISASASTSNNADWQAVEVELSKLDIGEAVPLAQEARQRGYPSAELRSIIAHQQQHRDKLGVAAIVYRIRNSPPGTPIDKGWPIKPAAKSRGQTDPRIESHFGPRLSKLSRGGLKDLAVRAGLTLIEAQLDHCRTQPGQRAKLLAQMAREADQ